MLAYSALSSHGPVSTTSPELLLAAFAVLDDRPRRATERDLVEALTVPLVDPLLDLRDDRGPAADDPLLACTVCALDQERATA